MGSPLARLPRLRGKLLYQTAAEADSDTDHAAEVGSEGGEGAEGPLNLSSV